MAGFAGAELLLAGMPLRLRLRAGRASEVLLLDAAGLRVIRTEAHGRWRERLLHAGWLSVRCLERPGRAPALVLTAGGIEEEIAASLGAAEKRQRAAALGAALHASRHPRFDSPRLRG